MIYGWGKKSKDWAMPDGRTLVCSYSYVSLMFVFKFVWSRKWHLIGRDRAMDVETNRQDLERTYGQGNVPDIGVFERFGMFVTGGLIVAEAVMMGLAPHIGRQRAHDLVYDCCRQCLERDQNFVDALMSAPEIADALTREAVEAFVDPRNYLGVAPEMVERYLSSRLP